MTHGPRRPMVPEGGKARERETPGRENNIKGNKIRRECNHPLDSGEEGQGLAVATMGGLGLSPRA